MGQLIYPILRGALVHPEAKTGIDYYLCIITLPTSIGSPIFTPIYPTSDPGTGIIEYSCNMQIEPGFNGPVTDFLLPVYANQIIKNVSQVKVTALNGNYIMGNPNNKIPPVNPISLTKDSNYEPTNTVFKGLYNSNNYFILMMVSTGTSQYHPTGGYTNAFKSFQLTADGNTLQGVLNPDSSITNGRAVIGAYAVTVVQGQQPNQPAYSQAIDKDGNNCTSEEIDYSSPILI